MRVAALACVVALSLTGCSWGDDGDDDEAVDDTPAEDSGCPVEPGRVGELLGYEVVVADDKGATSSCRYEPTQPDAHPGGEVIVAERRLADDGYDAALASVEAAAGPTRPLGDGEVDGADRGWIAGVGRVVQVGAVRGNRLVQVTVADAGLDVAAAEEIALELAGQAIS